MRPEEDIMRATPSSPRFARLPGMGLGGHCVAGPAATETAVPSNDHAVGGADR
jgi:hypothetical protein